MFRPKPFLIALVAAALVLPLSPAFSGPVTAAPAVNGRGAANAKVPPARAQDHRLLRRVPTRKIAATKPAARYQAWMSPEIADAWASGYKGQGTTVTVVDDFSSRSYFSGNLGTGGQSLRHGEWTRLEASMIAPSATIASQEFASGRTVPLAASGLNVVNLSYGMFARAGYTPSQIGWAPQETSLISYAGQGRAVISKAAGNDGVAVDGVNRAGNADYLNIALVGTQSAIFVGALTRNGTVDQKASLASYSNFAGADPRVQAQFLSVGVRGDLTNLYGTSFAAPVVSGYAAVLGSKFTTATPAQISSRLLDTARSDTILNYDAALHGRGEASIARALAPSSIN